MNIRMSGNWTYGNGWNFIALSRIKGWKRVCGIPILKKRVEKEKNRVAQEVKRKKK